MSRGVDHRVEDEGAGEVDGADRVEVLAPDLLQEVPGGLFAVGDELGLDAHRYLRRHATTLATMCPTCR